MNSSAVLINASSPSRMSSREIAELTGRAHDNVLRDVRILIEGGVLRVEETPYVHHQNGQTYPEFLLCERDCLVLVSGYNAPMRARIIDRWMELESRQPYAMPTHAEALRLYADQIEETQRVTAERDKAIATKALIGSRREATAMATASAAAREAAQLKEQLGRGVKHATVAAVEKALGRPPGEFSFVPMSLWCHKHKDEALRVDNLDYGFVLAWPAGAWLDVHKVDLVELFGSVRSD